MDAMIRKMSEHDQMFAHSYEYALQVATSQVRDEFGSVFAAFETLAASTSTLQMELVRLCVLIEALLLLMLGKTNTETRTSEVARKQDAIVKVKPWFGHRTIASILELTNSRDLGNSKVSVAFWPYSSKIILRP